jgi:hypothetical protein
MKKIFIPAISLLALATVFGLDQMRTQEAGKFIRKTGGVSSASKTFSSKSGHHAQTSARSAKNHSPGETAASDPIPSATAKPDAVSLLLSSPVPLPIAPVPVAVEMLKAAFHGDRGLGGLFEPLRNQFANRLRNDPDFVAGVLGQMKNEKDPNFLKFLAKEMAKNAQCSRDLAVQMDGTAVDENESPERRRAALDILIDTFKPDAGLLQSISQLADDADPQVRLSAVDALAAWLKRPDQLQGLESQIVQELVGIINTSTDEQVWAHGLEALNGQHSRLSLEVLQALPNLWEHATTSENRELAASTFALADDAAKAFALEQLEKGFLRESDAEARQYIAVQMVTLGREESYARLQQLVPHDSALLQQLQTYVQLAQNTGGQ